MLMIPGLPVRLGAGRFHRAGLLSQPVEVVHACGEVRLERSEAIPLEGVPGNPGYGGGGAICAHGFRFVRGRSSADRGQLQTGCSGNYQ